MALIKLKKKEKKDEQLFTPASPEDLVPKEPEKTKEELQKEGREFIQTREKFLAQQEEAAGKQLQFSKADVQEAGKQAQQFLEQQGPTKTIPEVQRTKKIVSKLGQVEEIPKLPSEGVLTTAALSIPKIATGAAAGAAFGGPLGAVAGGGFALLGQIVLDQRQSVKESRKFLTTGRTRDNEILNMANSGVDPSIIVEMYNLNLANLYAARRNLKEKTKTAIGRQLSGAMDELIEVEAYLDLEEFRRQQLINAIANPDPNKILPIQTIETENI